MPRLLTPRFCFFFSVWRPLKEPTDDWPLAVCDYTTIDKEKDILLNDAIRRDRVDEICVLQFNASHKWYYLRNQKVDDLLVFRNADSEGAKPCERNTFEETLTVRHSLIPNAGAFHAAVNNPEARGPPRESIEVRLVAIY